MHPGTRLQMRGSAPRRRIAVSHICSAGTPKIEPGSTSVVSHDEVASLLVELPGSPAGVADDDARAGGRWRLQQLQRQLLRDEQQHARTDLTLLLVRASATPPSAPMSAADRPVRRSRAPAQDRRAPEARSSRSATPARHRPVDDETEGAFLGVVAEQHDRPGEVRIRHLGHREEEERGRAGHDPIYPCRRTVDCGL